MTKLYSILLIDCNFIKIEYKSTLFFDILLDPPIYVASFQLLILDILLSNKWLVLVVYDNQISKPQTFYVRYVQWRAFSQSKDQAQQLFRIHDIRKILFVGEY